MPTLAPDLKRLFRVCFRLVDNIRLEDVLESKEFREAIAARHSLLSEHPEDTIMGVLLRGEPKLVQLALNQEDLKTLLPAIQQTAIFGDEEYFFESALLERLGKEALAATVRQFSPELVVLAGEMKAADTERQKEICVQLYHLLRSKGVTRKELGDRTSLEYTLDDLEDQPFTRIFARYFMKPDGSGRPNCFGKGQLLTAFAQLAEIPVLGSTPVVKRVAYMQPKFYRLSKVVLQGARKYGLSLPTKLQQRLFELEESMEEADEAPDAFHLAAAFQLRDESWYYLDPHQHAHGPLEGRFWLMNKRVVPMLDDFAPLHPGLALLATEPVRADQVFEKHVIEAGERYIGPALHILKKGIGFRKPESVPSVNPEGFKASAKVQFSLPPHGDPERNPTLTSGVLSLEEIEWEARALFSTFAQRETLETLLNSTLFEEADRVSLYAYLNGKANLGIEFMFRNPLKPDEIPPPEDVAETQTGMLILDYLMHGKLMWAIRQKGAVSWLSVAREGVLKAVRIMLTLGFNHVSDIVMDHGDCEKVIHPAVEFYRPETRIGIELLSHVNVSSLESEEVIQTLANHCASPLHLLAAATKPLREGDEEAEKAAMFAALLLQRFPMLPRSAERGLDLLESLGYIESKEG